MGRKESGTLDLILGCMYSGKTNNLIQRVKDIQRKTAGNVLVITHTIDKRYTDIGLGSHDGNVCCARKVSRLGSLVETDEYKRADVVCIDEAHFFEDLDVFVRDAVENHGKKVVVCGLDSDYNRNPFRNVVDLVPYADNFEKLTGTCYVCGERALFSKRIVNNENDRILVGSFDMYQPVCRAHFS